MRLFVDAWDPAYGSSGQEDGGPTAHSSARVDPTVELPAEAWRPLLPPADLRAPDTVLVVDGVRRNEARIWVEDDAGVTHPGLAASYAAGAVRCDLVRGAAELVASRIGRGLFTPAHGVPSLGRPPARYDARHVKGAEPAQLDAGVQARLSELEVEVSDLARAQSGSTVDDDDLLVLDGSLRDRWSLPRAVGYIKTHHRSYLTPPLSGIVAALPPGARTPVFELGTSWVRYSWYLRLPGPAGSAWAGVARVECSTELTVQQVIALADRSAVTLPRFAASPYKDPRAPQNLIPIAGLERRLRALLGDRRLLHRMLVRQSAAGSPPVPAGAVG